MQHKWIPRYLRSVQALEGNLWKLFGYVFLGEFWVIAPVLLPYYQANGLTTAECLGVQAIYAVGVVLFEVPSGYWADRVGRRIALVSGGLLVLVGVSCYAVSASFWAFAVSELLIAAGNSMRSGTDAALIYDTLLELRREDQYAVWQGRTEMWSRFGMASAAILGGLAAAIDLKVPFFVNIGTGAVMTVLALGLVEPARKRMEASPWQGITEVVWTIVRSRPLMRVALFGALLRASGVIGVWSYVLYFQAVGLEVSIFGALWAVFGLVCGIGARLSSTLSAAIGVRSVFLLCALLIPALFAVLGLHQCVWLVPLMWVNGFLWNSAHPLLLTIANRAFTSDRRATSISVLAVFSSLMYATCGPLFGLAVDQYSLSTAYLVMAGVLAVGALLVMPHNSDRPGAVRGQPVETTTPGG